MKKEVTFGESASIIEKLFSLRDEKYAEFQGKLIPTVEEETIIGVRTPDLRKYAKELAGTDLAEAFLQDLPHSYFEENQLHAFVISETKDFQLCVEQVSRFLPYVDNWATCDQLSPRIFKKHREELSEQIDKWLASKATYTVRFAIGMLMEHFLEADFTKKLPEKVAGIRSEEYYINMMKAWYFATALAKQYEAVIPFIENRKLDTWSHNKAIQKSIESRRISPAQKEYLKSLKIK